MRNGQFFDTISSYNCALSWSADKAVWKTNSLVQWTRHSDCWHKTSSVQAHYRGEHRGFFFVHCNKQLPLPHKRWQSSSRAIYFCHGNIIVCSTYLLLGDLSLRSLWPLSLSSLFSRSLSSPSCFTSALSKIDHRQRTTLNNCGHQSTWPDYYWSNPVSLAPLTTH